MLRIYIDKFGFDKSILFKNQEFIIESGKVVGIIGENGTGKSTLLNMICGNLNSTLKMTYNDTPIIPGYNDKIIAISDDFIGLEYLTPIEVVQYFLLIYGKSFNKNKFDRIVNLVSIDKEVILNEIIKNLSKGTKQKVVFIIYMMLDIDIIIFDEGLENIDKKSLCNILEELREWVKDNNKLCLIATHSSLILEFVDEFICLEKSGNHIDGTIITKRDKAYNELYKVSNDKVLNY